MLSNGTKVRRLLNGRLYPTASLTGSVLADDGTHTKVRWDDGGVSTVERKTLLPERKTR